MDRPATLSLDTPDVIAARPLDESVLATGTTPWGWRPVAVPLVAFALVIVVSQVIARSWRPTSPTERLAGLIVVNGLAETVVVLGIWFAGRQVAAANGGWSVFGLRRPCRADLGPAAVGIVATFAVRYLVVLAVTVVSHGRAAAQANNVHLTSIWWPGIAVLFVLTVVLAPLLEELTFRGLLLRSFMRRLTFAPAAVLSTVIFALFHTYEAATVLGAVTLALSVSCIGAVNCILVRRTDRLTPGMYSHAVLNAIVLGVAIAVAR